MSLPRLLLGVALLGLVLTPHANAADDPQPAAAPATPVPHGELIRFPFSDSRMFPGTTRTVTVYVPRQYDPARPACVYVNQDGLQWHADTVFDELIARREIPVVIGVFVTPGEAKAADPADALDRLNRSYEYDGMGGAYVRFILDEILPAVEAKTTSDGRPIRLSHSGNDRAIGGSSSGAIAAFTAAWERPDAFSRVFSAIGTYVDLRGGGIYPALIRRYEPKPIRVFLQDGDHDLNIYAGDWWMANQTMERALRWAGYDVTHVWGAGTHNGEHGTAVFPDAMRWLWRDWPKPVARGTSQNDTLAALLIPGEDWQLVAEHFTGSEGSAVNPAGEVFFNDFAGPGRTFRIGLDGNVSLEKADAKRANGQTFDAQGRLYSVSVSQPQVLRYERDGSVTVLADGIAGNDVVVAHNGNVYVTDPPPASSNAPSKVWIIRPDGTKQVIDTGVRYANGVTLSPDQSLLYVNDYWSHWVYSYRIQPDGTVTDKQRYYWLFTPDAEDSAKADGMRVDRAGRLYVGTALGVQVCDQMGRVQCILPSPVGGVTNLVFGGPKFDILYAMCGDHVYRRRLNTVGANAWDVPNKPAPPKL